MKLLRAYCECGVSTKKVRMGYHHQKWWFPLYSLRDGELSDIHCSLPGEAAERINNYCDTIYHQTPHEDKKARRIAGAAMERFTKEVQSDFIARELNQLTDQFLKEGVPFIFNPSIGDCLHCPNCYSKKLVLKQVVVTAFCKSECSHEYQWLDSIVSGCPKCNHRPHRFQMDIEKQFEKETRITCSCLCSTTTNCISFKDGFCPKCGSLPVEYSTPKGHFCGIHSEEFITYSMPLNFLFQKRASNLVIHQFPNAKFWGDAVEPTDIATGMYCQSCESDYQKWLL